MLIAGYDNHSGWCSTPDGIEVEIETGIATHMVVKTERCSTPDGIEVEIDFESAPSRFPSQCVVLNA